MKIVFSNICGGLIFGGETYGELLFKGVSLEHYIQQYQKLSPDILSLAEVHLEADGSSAMAQELSEALGLPYYRAIRLDHSFLDTSKEFGIAIFSRYPIVAAERFTIPSPKLEVDHPSGQHWVMHDKGAQRVVLDVDGRQVAVVNFSYFPFHHFGRRTDEPEFAPLRQQLLGILLDGKDAMPTIVTGDFNNKHVPLKQGFPELFSDNRLAQAVVVPTTVLGYDDQQFDNILYQPQHFFAKAGFALDVGSDHLAIGAELTIL